MAVHFPPLPAQLSNLNLTSSQILLLLPLLLLPTFIVYNRLFSRSSTTTNSTTSSTTSNTTGNSSNGSDNTSEKKEVKSVMQPPNPNLAPARNDPFTLADLKKYDGSDPNGKIYVAIKGTVFDVTHKRDMYGKGKSYNLLAGTDGSRALGLSSLHPVDAVPDWSTLDAEQRRVLDEWHEFFERRYNIMGRVTDLPAAVANL